MTSQDFIQKRKHLVWGVKDPRKMSDESIVEACLNYGDFEDFKALLKILGTRKTASIFQSQIKGKRCNYSDKTKNYFKLYFARNA